MDRRDAAHLPLGTPGRVARDGLRRAQGIREGVWPQGATDAQRATRRRGEVAAVPDGGELVFLARAGHACAGDSRLEPRLGERLVRLAEQVSLEERATDLLQRVALVRRLHALGDDGDSQVLAKIDDRGDQLALRRLLVDAANERHVELDDMRLELGEAGEAGVSGAEVVHGDPVAHLLQLLDPTAGVLDVVEAGPLGDLEHDAFRVPRERSGRIEEVLVHQIGRVQIDEDLSRSRGELGGHRVADSAAEVGEPAQPLGGADQIGRTRELRLRGAHEGFVTEESPVRPAHDGLERHPQAFESALEGALERRPVGEERVVVAQIFEGLALELPQPMERGGAADDGLQLVELDRLHQVAEGAVLDRLQRGLQIRTAGHEYDGKVGGALANRAEQLDAGDPGHADVGEDRVVALVLEHPERGFAVLGHFHFESVGSEGAREDAAQPLVIIGEQEACVAHAVSAKGVDKGIARSRWTTRMVMRFCPPPPPLPEGPPVEPTAQKYCSRVGAIMRVRSLSPAWGLYSMCSPRGAGWWGTAKPVRGYGSRLPFPTTKA